MKGNVSFINDLYQNASMGIIGIDDVLYKVKNPKLYKEMENEKKEYQKIVKICKKLLKERDADVKEVNMMAKISSELYSEYKLMKNASDESIIKMMIEGSYKSVGILKTKLMENKNCEEDVLSVANKLLKTVQNNINNLERY